MRMNTFIFVLLFFFLGGIFLLVEMPKVEAQDCSLGWTTCCTAPGQSPSRPCCICPEGTVARCGPSGLCEPPPADQTCTCVPTCPTCPDCVGYCQGRLWRPPQCNCGECTIGTARCEAGKCQAQCGSSTFRVNCGNFASSCSSDCYCRYYPASIVISSVTPVCSGILPERNQLIISGSSGYCGLINISTSWENSAVPPQSDYTIYQDYPFSRTLAVPEDILQQHINSGSPLRIRVIGNRNQIKDSKDRATYECEEVIEILLSDRQCASPVICGAFSSGCSNTCTCTYNPGNLDFSLSSPCVDLTDESRNFVVSGNSGYCGQIRISTSWGDERVVAIPPGQTIYDNYPFLEGFSIPEDVLDSHMRGAPITIRVRGNRESLSSPLDTTPINCDREYELIVRYNNFYYCPKQGVSAPEFRYYDLPLYYEFPGRTQRYDWEDCTSMVSVNSCCPSATDCVTSAGVCSPVANARDVDTDGEIEVCHSLDFKQGGWLDPDEGEQACIYANSIRETKWLDCRFDNGQKNEECSGGRDDFDSNPDTGLCCGDDPGEYPTSTRVHETSFSYSGCCGSPGRCVDELGICRPAGSSRCAFEGYSMRCQVDDGEGTWVLEEDEDCEDLCNKCDVNRDGRVDLTDITAIYNYQGSSEALYDIDRSGVVDLLDVILCSQDSVFEHDCMSAQYCGDNVFQDFEKCERVDGDYFFNDVYCPASSCGPSGREHYTFVRNDSQCFNCLFCSYDSSCIPGACGAECSSEQACRRELVEFCLEEGLNQQGLSDNVIRVQGDAGFSRMAKDSWCCDEIGEYYLRNHGRLTVSIPALSAGEYRLSFGYRVLHSEIQGSLKIRCGGREISIPYSVLRHYQPGNEFSWMSHFTCLFESGSNEINFDMDGPSTIYISSISIIRSGEPECRDCVCRNTGSCGDGILQEGEICEPGTAISCPTSCAVTTDETRTGIMIGDASFCDARCIYVESICGIADGVCPANCPTDPDCRWIPR